MNIIFVIYRLGTGGAERVSVLLAEYLKEQGHNVSVLVYLLHFTVVRKG